MPRPITIRAAGPAEAEAIWRLTVEAYMPDRERLHPPSGVFRETVADVQRAMDEGTVYMARRGADMVGAVRVQPARDQDAMYCGRLAVLPALRRQGIGTALMERVERHAREAGYPAVVLGVRLELPDNLRFFARLGYRMVGEASHPGYTTPTFAWLRKDLIADKMGGHIFAALAHLRAVDPVLGRLIDAVGSFRLQRDPSPFYALFSSIVSQQISVRAAATIMSRIEALFPPGEHVTAARVLALGAEPLRAAGLSGMKTRYVLDLSERASDGRLDLDRLATLDDEAVIAELVQVKGIGRWTAEMFLIFALGRLDVLPVDDLGFRAAVKQQYGFDELPTADQLRTLGACWAPYRTVATWYLWRSLGNTPRGA